MFFLMFIASPFVFLFAVAAAVYAGLRGPKGVSYLVWLGLIGAGTMASLDCLLTVGLLADEGARIQQDYLGREYAGLFDLRGVQMSEFPDPMEEFVYRPNAEALSVLKARCRPGAVDYGHDCVLFHHGDFSDFSYAYLEGDTLIVGFRTT